MQRIVRKPFFRVDPLGDVAVDNDEFFNFALLVFNSARGRFEYPPAAVLVP
jgi:hypothetical protein